MRKRRKRKLQRRLLKAEPDLLRSDITRSDDSVGVDRGAKVIRGYVVAQEGRFKSKGRGQFTTESLQKIVQLGNAAPNGIRSRFGHPNASDDGLGKYLGRAKNFRLDGNKVRADLHLNETSLEPPPQGGRPLGEYVMQLADTDPGAFSSSVVVLADKEPIDGQPPVWHPTHLYASDVVDTGDAVDDFLSADFLEDLPTGVVHQATQLVDQQFAGQPRDVVEARLRAFMSKYLDHKFGPESPQEEGMSAELESRIAKLEAGNDSLTKKLDAVAESLGSLTDTLKADREEQQKARLADARAKKITALCAQCGVDAKQANDWIADESLSIEDVKDKLLLGKFEASKPAGDGGGSEPNLSKDEKYLREYELHAKDHKALGITKQEYIELRKAEESDEDPLEGYMSPEWAMEYAKN